MFMLGVEISILEWYLHYRSSVRKRGTDDGIVEISNRSNFLREREGGRNGLYGGQKIGKIVF